VSVAETYRHGAARYTFVCERRRAGRRGRDCTAGEEIALVDDGRAHRLRIKLSRKQ
jgi:hypothetical protein